MSFVCTIPMGTLRINGKIKRFPTTPGVTGNALRYTQGKTITIGDTSLKHPENTILWNVINGMERWSRSGTLFVADRVLLRNVSWEDLARNGFIDGTVIQVDGKQYRCRAPYIGMGSKDELNEWDDIVIQSPSPSIWKIRTFHFWGAEDLRFCYDQCNKIWNGLESEIHSSFVGFLPVLEPLEASTSNVKETTYPDFRAGYRRLGLREPEIKEMFLTYINA